MVGTLAAAEPNADVPFNVEDTGVFLNDGLIHLFDVWCIDAPMPTLRLGPNDAWVYLSHPSHPHIPTPEGSFAWITRVRTATTDMGPVLDVFRTEKTMHRGIPEPKPGQRGWTAWMMHHHVINDRESLAVFHYEGGHPLAAGQDTQLVKFRLGLGYSKDGGASYDHLGFAISTWAPDPTPESLKMPNGGHVNISGAGIRADDDYLYYYFNDSFRESALEDGDPKAAHMAVARAPLREVIENARGGRNTEWKKFYEGQWNEPGLGGRSASLGKMTEYHTSLVYNTHIKKWITFDVDWQTRRLCMRRSSDPLDFHVPNEPVFQFGRGDTVAYTSVLPLEPGAPGCGKDFYVIFRNHGTNDETGRAFYHVKKLKIVFD